MSVSRYALAVLVAGTIVVAAALLAWRLGEDGREGRLPPESPRLESREPGERGPRDAARFPPDAARSPGGDPLIDPAARPAADPPPDSAKPRRGDRARDAEISRETGELQIRVLDTAGQAIPSARVRLFTAGSEIEPSEPDSSPARFPGLAPGRYGVRVELAPDDRRETPSGVEIRGRETRAFDVVLARNDLGIGGRVLDDRGVGVPDLLVTATPHPPSLGPSVLLPVGSPPAERVTDLEGRFEFTDLCDVEHELRVESAGPHETLAWRVVRAGAMSVELVLHPLVEVRVHGRITDESGGALAGALVTPLVAPDRAVTSDATGRYELTLEIGAKDAVQSIAFSYDGHRTEQIHLRHEHLVDREEYPLDVALRAVGVTAPVGGRLSDADGRAVVGETVLLQSASQRVRTSARSDRDGVFAFEDVPLASDYRLWVHPAAEFADAVEEPIEIGGDGVFVELALERIGTGALRGRVLDTAGVGVSGIGFSVRSTRALGRAESFVTGPLGAFEVPSVSAGELIFETRSTPRFTVRGFELESGAESEIELVIDRGSGALRGEIVDNTGAPIAVARIDLYWSRESAAGRSSSYRSTSSDRSGSFVITDLGAGEHKLVIDAPGFRRERRTIDVSEAGFERLRIVLEAVGGR